MPSSTSTPLPVSVDCFQVPLSVAGDLHASSHDASFISQVQHTLHDFGVCVIPEAFPASTLSKLQQRTFDWLHDLGSGIPELDRMRNSAKDWAKISQERVPMGPKAFMMQSLVSHSPVAWELRELLRPLFEILYPHFPDTLDSAGRTTQLLSSLDGATLRPPVAPFFEGNAENEEPSTKDWAHVDQLNNPLLGSSRGEAMQSPFGWSAVQGQAVLSASPEGSAAFRATPMSHRVHARMLKETGVSDSEKGQWKKFSMAEMAMLKQMVQEETVEVKGALRRGVWQMPIYTPQAGAIILWDSRTIHSAKPQSRPSAPMRLCYYTCMRPRLHFSEDQIRQLATAAKERRTTNHWGTTVFQKKPGARFSKKRVASLEAIQQNPLLLEELPDRSRPPTWNDGLKELVGM